MSHQRQYSYGRALAVCTIHHNRLNRMTFKYTHSNINALFNCHWHRLGSTALASYRIWVHRKVTLAAIKWRTVNRQKQTIWVIHNLMTVSMCGAQLYIHSYYAKAKAPQLWQHFTLYSNNNKQCNAKSTYETKVSKPSISQQAASSCIALCYKLKSTVQWITGPWHNYPLSTLTIRIVYVYVIHQVKYKA